MKTSFSKIIEFILKEEGGYVNDPADPGGETKYGISKRSYPNLNIRDLSESEAVEIYKKDYWAKIKGDDLPYPLDMCAMDAAVNMGVGAATELLKETADYRDFLLNRIARYISIVYRRPASQKFFRGWIIRVSRLRTLCRG